MSEEIKEETTEASEEELLVNGERRLTPEEAAEAGRRLAVVADNVEKVIVGKRPVVELIIASMIVGGHVLLEDVPGTGKTTLVTALAKSVDCGFKRIQFTPDLLPSDVTGFSVYNPQTGQFEFRPGGVMSNIVLADEINRAPAKTQSALLEAMAEQQVTVDSKTYYLDSPFLVLATQNPIENAGVYHLPEAQRDRFEIQVSLGYLTPEEEVRVINMPKRVKTDLGAVISRQEMLALSAMTDRVYVASSISEYIVQIVMATRSNAYTELGSSTRGSVSLLRLSRAYALLQGRDYVLPEDVKYLAPFVLAHRLVLNHKARTENKTERAVIEEILESIVVPEMAVK